MRPSEESKRDLVRQWVMKAEKDFSLAQHLVAEDCVYREAICFNSQQTAEKLLKGFLAMHQVDFPKTHNLGELLDLVAEVDDLLADALRLAERAHGAVQPKLSACLGGAPLPR